jgi:uncharacterized peroxidase-related enzyme
MAFISTTPVNQASGDVQAMYAEDETSKGYVPNYTKVFSHRPQVMKAWGNLLGSIRSNLDLRRYELTTLAASRALHSSYCMLAHGTVLLKNGVAPDQLAAIADDFTHAGLSPLEVAIMAFADKIVRDATTVTADDIQGLRDHGLSDSEIFDVAATAAVRCFFSKLNDALGAEPDAIYLDIEEGLRQHLVIGRPIGVVAESH